jgi:hypothetical protein
MSPAKSNISSFDEVGLFRKALNGIISRMKQLISFPTWQNNL